MHVWCCRWRVNELLMFGGGGSAADGETGGSKHATVVYIHAVLCPFTSKLQLQGSYLHIRVALLRCDAYCSTKLCVFNCLMLECQLCAVSATRCAVKFWQVLVAVGGFVLTAGCVLTGNCTLVQSLSYHHGQVVFIKAPTPCMLLQHNWCVTGQVRQAPAACAVFAPGLTACSLHVLLSLVVLPGTGGGGGLLVQHCLR
ncbi:hypothetical protein COO60DRAFT_1218720 [Scenedesmus sp. NREL 46B-D3]|nr:hypothetical protein COO60DRAFT_1218720 [Scenedesmus sp. NREL 46B-D3]